MPICIYLGPEGTYSHLASLKIFGNQAKVEPAANFEELFVRLDSGAVAYGVVPLENNSAGIVDSAFDLLIRSTSIIVGEFTLPIVHSLLSLETSLSAIKVLYSLPHPYYQSSQFLRRSLPADCRWIQSSSSTQSIKDCLANPKASAAVGFAETGRSLGLNVLKEGIQDMENNSTRFVVVSAREMELPASVASRSHWKTRKASIVFTLEDKPGTLLGILEIFHRQKLNLCHIESRPTRIKKWRYYFCLTVEGEGDVEATMRQVASMTPWSRVLGFYPVLGE